MRRYSYWEDVGGCVRNALTAPIPREVDILIVGAGFAGLWLAYFLKQQHPKLNIIVCERDLFSYGASSRNAGFLSCGNLSEWYEDAGQLGHEETLQTFQARIDGIQLIKAAMGVALSQDPCGSVDLDPPTSATTALMKAFNTYLKQKDFIPFYTIRNIKVGLEEQDVYFNSFDAAINPCDVLQWLHQALQQLEVPIFFCTEITAIAARHADWSQEKQAGQMKYSFAYVCTNAFARELNPASDVSPARGQILVTSPIQTSTFRSLGFLNAGYDYYRFLGDRLLVGGGRRPFKEQENTKDLGTSAEVQDYLVELAAKILGHSDFKVDYRWAGLMGLRQGKHASISELKEPRFIDRQTEDVNCCGGWGVTLTPTVMSHKARCWI